MSAEAGDVTDGERRSTYWFLDFELGERFRVSAPSLVRARPNDWPPSDFPRIALEVSFDDDRHGCILHIAAVADDWDAFLTTLVAAVARGKHLAVAEPP